mmetsp:Transcript_50297/g.139530  ORF Transcript_50297/g.139530 Transcript_50297/m.139530 type:complete len:117 (+) Transcript_50297:174-524(+)
MRRAARPAAHFPARAAARPHAKRGPHTASPSNCAKVRDGGSKPPLGSNTRVLQLRLGTSRATHARTLDAKTSSAPNAQAARSSPAKLRQITRGGLDAASTARLTTKSRPPEAEEAQ